MSKVRVPASFWWESLFDTWNKVCTEFIKRAQKAELEEKGHECGHLFEISVHSRGHYGIVGKGPESHKDADWMAADEPMTVQVRAHSLKQALLIAATLPLNDWWPEEDEEPDEELDDEGEEE
jgi:hypothetical protein